MMKLYEWLTGSNTLTANGVRHCLIALLMMLVFAPILGVLEVAFFVSGFFIGRERRDHEREAGLKFKDWYKGWDILELACRYAG